MALGMEVGLGSGDFAFDEDPAILQNRGHTHHQPVFGPCLLWPNGWIDEDATWYGSRPRPSAHCIRRGPSSARNGHSSPPSFRPMSNVAKIAGTKNDKVRYFYRESSCGVPSCAALLAGAATLVGKSAHAV